MINKTIQRSEDCFVQFTNEELTELGIKEGDKFSWEEDNGSILLKKHVPVEVDISDWSRDVLEMLICESIEKDISINDVICGIIEKAL
jgi:hypothetical protein